jgi:competence protein ComFC
VSNVGIAAEAVLDLLFPGSCLLCGGDLAVLATRSPHPVCADCVAGIRRIEGRRCRVCGTALSSEREICTRCRERSFAFDRALPLFAYQGALRELLYLYKFEGRRRLAALFAAWIACALVEAWPGVPVVPVPGRARVLRVRGWEHVGEIGRALERRHGIEVVRCLTRRGGGEQKGLDFAGRAANVRGRIVYGATAGRGLLRGARRAGLRSGGDAVLLDDVLTTGATADECARVLREHGTRNVHLVTLAID